MKGREVVKIIKRYGGVLARQRGSHRFFTVTVGGVTRHTTVSSKDGEDVPKGLLSKIERDLELALGKG